MQIGRMQLPDVEFPLGIEAALANYVQTTGDSLSYIAECGVDSPIHEGFEEGTFWLYAAYETGLTLGLHICKKNAGRSYKISRI